MALARKNHRSSRKAIDKALTGIHGLDELTNGGLPKGRPTLICGGAGCGKTMLAVEFLVRGATQYGESGVFMSFEETAKDLTENVASFGFDLNQLVALKKLSIDYVRISRNEIEESGEYDLDGLFVRLAYAIDSVKAQRVVLDTLEALFAEMPNPGILRAEIRRLFQWLKDKGVTAVITAERDQPNRLTRHGLEEFVSDCVILLDHRVEEQISTRRLRVVKYRGSSHGTHEYPFLIDKDGMWVLPISSLRLEHPASNKRISTGIKRLDEMIGGKGYFRGSSILISGTAGTGKTSIGASFVHSVCEGGECCLYLAFEESPDQIMRNMKSIGIDLRRWVDKGLLEFLAVRPTYGGIEQHLVTAYRAIEKLRPAAVVVDPITNLVQMGSSSEVQSLLIRLVDLFKTKNITAVFTSLTHGGAKLEATDTTVSSLMDTWLLLKMIETGGERNRVIYVLKSRGMEHSNQLREYVITPSGVQLADTYLGQEGVLTGSSRIAQEARDKASALLRDQELALGRRRLDRRRQLFEAQMKELRAKFEAEEEEITKDISRAEGLERQAGKDQVAMAVSRHDKHASEGKSSNGKVRRGSR